MLFLGHPLRTRLRVRGGAVGRGGRGEAAQGPPALPARAPGRCDNRTAVFVPLKVGEKKLAVKMGSSECFVACLWN